MSNNIFPILTLRQAQCERIGKIFGASVPTSTSSVRTEIDLVDDSAHSPRTEICALDLLRRTKRAGNA
ncbi:MAG: hypothetical protein LBD67_08015 [Candidatus Accumulibacter sp.]|nr:hypothetical protein [Accumulibacter sp.]